MRSMASTTWLHVSFLLNEAAVELFGLWITFQGDLAVSMPCAASPMGCNAAQHLMRPLKDCSQVLPQVHKTCQCYKGNCKHCRGLQSIERGTLEQVSSSGPH